MDTNIKLIKEIGSGFNGTAYLAEYNNIQMIYKIEKMDNYDKSKLFTSIYYRQIDFNENIAINNPNKFLVLKSHGIIYNCEYKHPGWNRLNKMKKKQKKRFLEKNSQSNCYYLLYYPYLDGTFNTIKNIILSNSKLFIDFMYQIIDSINIMRKNGYSQNDISANNIMYKKINDLQYQWYIIDYGNLYNNKYPITKLDNFVKDDNANYCQDLLMYINQLIFSHTNIINPYSDSVDNYIKNNKKYKKILKFIKKKKKLYNNFKKNI